MALNYSVVAKGNPTDPEADKLYYAQTQYESIISLEEFATHIASHGSVYTRDVIQGVLTKTVDCLKELLIDGKRVKLGELGTFQLSLRCKGAATADDFNFSNNVRVVRPVWTRGQFFKDFKDEETLSPKQVLTRKENAKALGKKS